MDRAEVQQKDALLVADIRAGIAVEFDAVQHMVARNARMLQQLDTTLQSFEAIYGWRRKWSRTLAFMCVASIATGIAIAIY